LVIVDKLNLSAVLSTSVNIYPSIACQTWNYYLLFFHMTLWKLIRSSKHIFNFYLL
jgi:hypothetical protein